MNKLQQFLVKAKSFITEAVRVIKVTKKPSMQNFKMIVKVSALGMLVIGVVGFIISVFGALIGIGV